MDNINVMMDIRGSHSEIIKSKLLDLENKVKFSPKIRVIKPT
jgi:hypothetical protein